MKEIWYDLRPWRFNRPSVCLQTKVKMLLPFRDKVLNTGRYTHRYSFSKGGEDTLYHVRHRVRQVAHHTCVKLLEQGIRHFTWKF